MREPGNHVSRITFQSRSRLERVYSYSRSGRRVVAARAAAQVFAFGVQRGRGYLTAFAGQGYCQLERPARLTAPVAPHEKDERFAAGLERDSSLAFRCNGRRPGVRPFMKLKIGNRH